MANHRDIFQVSWSRDQVLSTKSCPTHPTQGINGEYCAFWGVGVSKWLILLMCINVIQ